MSFLSNFTLGSKSSSISPNNNPSEYEIKNHTIAMKPAGLCDFTINLHGIAIKCHKAILCNASEYFSTLLLDSKDKQHDSTVNSIDLPSDFSGSLQLFTDFLDYLYNPEKSIYLIDRDQDAKLPLKPQFRYNLNQAVEVNGWNGNMQTYYAASITNIDSNSITPYHIRYYDGVEQDCKEENIRLPQQANPNNAVAPAPLPILTAEQKELLNGRIQYCENLLYLTHYFTAKTVETRVQRFLIKMLYRDSSQMWRLLSIAERFRLLKLRSHCIAIIVRDPQRHQKLESQDYLKNFTKETLIQLCSGLSKIAVPGIVPVEDEDLYQ